MEANNNPANFIYNGHQLNRQQELNDTGQHGVVILPYAKCKDCDCVYISQTSCALKTRVKEHAKAIATLDENSLLAKHHMRHGHQIDLASVEIVGRSSAWRQRLILEAWHSVQDRNAINEHIVLPNVYNSIKNL